MARLVTGVVDQGSGSASRTADVVAEIEAAKRERERLKATPTDPGVADPDDALAWLASLGRLWRETSDEGRPHLAVATFERIGVLADHARGSHRIAASR